MKKLLLSLATILLVTCSHKETILHSDRLLYQCDITGKECPLRVLTMKAEADTLGVFRIALTVMNPDKTPVTVSRSGFQLETDAGMRTPLTLHDTTWLVTETPVTINLSCRPINSLTFYQQTGLPGDIHAHYLLTNAGIKFEASLKTEEQALSEYRDRWGYTTRVIVYTPHLGEDFTDREKMYLTTSVVSAPDIQTIKHGAHVTDQEVLIDGLNMRFNTYALLDTVYLRMRLINRAPFVVSLHPMHMNLSAGSTMRPVITTVDSLNIPRSQRAELWLKYFAPSTDTKDIAIDVSSLVFQAQKPVPVFCDSLIRFRNSVR